MGQTFFGFNAEDRVKFHENIFNLIWWGAGRWDWDTIYHMPVHIRRFWTKKLNKIIEEELEEKQRKQQAAKRRRRAPKSPM